MEKSHFSSTTLHLAMIKYTLSAQCTLKLFQTSFEHSLDATNRWILMSEMVPWDEMAKVFFPKLSKDISLDTIDIRIVSGALMVKHIEDLSDERAIEYVQENIYAQYFVGLSNFTCAAIFVPSLFVKIRERLGEQGVMKINDLMIAEAVRLRAIKHRRKTSDGYDKSQWEGQGGGGVDSKSM